MPGQNDENCIRRDSNHVRFHLSSSCYLCSLLNAKKHDNFTSHRNPILKMGKLKHKEMVRRDIELVSGSPASNPGGLC